MAGAETAWVPARAGTILGVTRAIASPAYRRLEQLEPWLRLAVPALLALFLVTLAASAWIQLRDGREEAVVDAINDIDIIATLSAAKIGGRAAPADRIDAASQLNELVRELPAGALARGRMLLLADRSGTVLATFPPAASAPRMLAELLGDAQPLMIFVDRAGVMTIRMADGADAIAT